MRAIMIINSIYNNNNKCQRKHMKSSVILLVIKQMQYKTWLSYPKKTKTKRLFISTVDEWPGEMNCSIIYKSV